MNLYCPPDYSPDFLSKAFAVFMEQVSGDSFVRGDFNCRLNPLLDKRPSDTVPLLSRQGCSLINVMILNILMCGGCFYCF